MQPRAFSNASEPIDERVPVLLVLLSAAIKLQRRNGLEPIGILASPQVYTSIIEYLGVSSLVTLFGLPIEADCNTDAVPFVIVCQPRISRLEY